MSLHQEKVKIEILIFLSLPHLQIFLSNSFKIVFLFSWIVDLVESESWGLKFADGFTLLLFCCVMKQKVQGEKDGSCTGGELKKCWYPTRRFLMAQIWSEAHQGVSSPPVSLNILIFLIFFFAIWLKLKQAHRQE
jgi:hypothetical protein